MKDFNKLFKNSYNDDKILYIFRGIPSSGKSTKAKSLVPNEQIFSADKYFEKDGPYMFVPQLLGSAHKACFDGLESAMISGITPLAVDNTNTTLKEINPYIQLAKKRGYSIEIVESDRPEWKKLSSLIDKGIRDGKEIEALIDFFYEDNKKTHNVPRFTFKKMIDRWVPTRDIEV